jgi:hypothetical protein
VDYGLFVSVGLSALLVWLAPKVWKVPELGDRAPLDQLIAPLFVGMVLGRAITLVFSDLAGITSIREFMTIRGGVEFWPGVAAGTFVLVVLFHRPDDPPPVRRVALLAPFAMVMLAGFQITCLVRDGCAGPESAVGLVPHGLTTRQLPVGVLGGVALIALAGWLRVSTLPDHTRVLVAVFGVGAERSLLGVTEPNLRSALSRDGLAMVLMFAAAVGWWAWFEKRERAWRLPAHPMSAPGQ